MGIKKRNSFLNLLKVFACINVVFIHVIFPGKFGQIVQSTGSFAVPLFFIIAGFYSFNKSAVTIKRRLIKTIFIFAFAYLCFFVFRISYAAYNHEVSQWLKENYRFAQLAKYVVFCTIQFAYPLWYLVAQIETYIFWLIVVKFGKEKLVVKLMPLMFLAQIVLTVYCETKGLYWFFKTNFVTSSLSWFTLGYFIHSLPEEKIAKLNTKLLALLAVAGWVITCLPVIYELKIRFACIGYIPLTVSLFLIALKYSNVNIWKPLDYFGDKMSLWVYIFHVPVGAILLSINESLLGINVDSNLTYKWIHPVLTALVTSVIALLVSLLLKCFASDKSNENMSRE